MVTTIGPAAAGAIFPPGANVPLLPGQVYQTFAPAEIAYGPGWSQSYSSALPPGVPTIFGLGPQGTGGEAAGGGGRQFIDWSAADDDLGEDYGGVIMQPQPLPQFTGLFWLGAIGLALWLASKK